MPQRLRFLLIFFLPVASAVGIAFLFGWLFFQMHQTEHSSFVRAQSRDLGINTSATELSHQMLNLQNRLYALLKQAKAGQADEEAVYRFHVELIDQLAVMDKELGELQRNNQYPEITSLLDPARSSFDEYRRLTSVATDIVAIDPEQAGHYIEAANSGYFAFAEAMQHVAAKILKLTQQRMIDGEQSLEQQMQVAVSSGLTIFLLMILLWLLVVWLAARYLAVVTNAFGNLARNCPIDTVDRRKLTKIHGFFVKDLADTALAFEQANIARAQAERALLTEQKQLELLLRSMPDLVWFKDADGHYRRCNPRFEAFAGKSEAQLAGLSDLDLFPPDDAERYRLQDQQAAEAGDVVSERQWRNFADGHRELLEIHKVAVRDEAGELVGVLGVGRDVTTEYLAEENLKSSEAALKRTQTVARLGSWSFDYRFNTLVGSEEASRILGIPLGRTLSPRDFFRDVAPADRSTVWQAWQQAASRGVFDVEHRIVINDETRWVRQRAEVEYDPNGQPGRAIGMVQDITSIKAATEALRQREEIFSAIVSQAESGMLLVDGDTLEIIEFNDAAADNLGYRRAEFSRLTLHDLRADGPDPEFATHLKALANVGAMFELRQRRQDGTPRDFLMSAKPLTTQDRQQLSVVWNDITERKQVEKDLENYRNHLEELVAERTVELAQARDAAQSASRSKSAFLANMSHEIRTPMNAIIGLTHMLHRDVADPHQRLQLDKIAGAARHLLGVINDILDFSKIEAGKLSLEPTDFDLDHVVGNACTLVADKAQEKGLELVADISALPPILHGDGLRLGQVLLNFLSNAVKFTEHGSVVIRASIIDDAPDAILARFEVQDSGIGLSEEQRERLFQAFSQADVSTTRKYGGTGLGLAISRRLVELMDGKIGVESQPGSGSTFWVEIRLGKVAGKNRQPALEVLPAGTRALVLDDIEDARQSMASALTELGARPTTFASGEAALQAIQAADQCDDPYTLVITDWQMPGMDGMTFGQRLAELKLRCRPTSFLVSGTLGAPSDALASGGFAGFIAKPMTPSALLVALERHHDQLGKTLPGARSHLPDGAESPRWLAGRRVLLAEDNPLNREVALDLLQEVGLQVDIAEDGQQALDKLGSGTHYDLILMDIQMPVMDGLTATRRIRELPAHRHTPIVAMTANAFEDDRRAALDAGMDDHIAKPVEPDRLHDMLQRWLPGTAPRESPEIAAATPSTGEANDPAENLERLSRIPDFDIDRGLRSTRGNAEKLRRLIGHFIEAHRDETAALEQALAAGDIQTARRQAHTLKGSAGTLGLTGIADLAARLEQSILHDEPAPSSIRQLGEALAELARQLAGQTETAPTAQGEPETDEHLPDEIAALRQLIATDDIAAVDTFLRLKTRFRNLAGRSVDRLGEELENFSYDTALATLDAIIANEPGLRREIAG